MTEIKSIFKFRWHEETSAAPLAIYRIGFGILMLFSTLRFIFNGWVETQYVQPSFHFSYYGFEWLPYPSQLGIYALFTAMIVGAVLILLGLFYRFGAALFFLSFTYVELLDKTNYLNHYYFVSLIALLLVFIPANKYFSLDACFGFTNRSDKCAKWNIGILQFQIAIVYIFAGIAKLEPDWLLEAQPLKYWLHTAHHYPLVGDFLKQDWVAYTFAWFGCIYDLTIVFFLINRRTRKYAYFFVIVFHLATWLLFPIGVFPWVMMFATLIFFAPSFHERLLDRLRLLFGAINYKPTTTPNPRIKKLTNVALATYITIQVFLPFRYLFYDGNLMWTEQGFRFSWRVMLMEKAGHATFYVKDSESDTQLEINNCDYLTANQEKMMSTQPDMILQFAHFLEEEYADTTIQRHGVELKIKDPEVHAEVFVALNSRPHQLYVDAKHDLTKIENDLSERFWLEEMKE